jgi:hypothetical protein
MGSNPAVCAPFDEPALSCPWSSGTSQVQQSEQREQRLQRWFSQVSLVQARQISPDGSAQMEQANLSSLMV